MLERKISDDLLEWKRSGTGKALLLTGARQSRQELRGTRVRQARIHPLP